MTRNEFEKAAREQNEARNREVAGDREQRTACETEIMLALGGKTCCRTHRVMGPCPFAGVRSLTRATFSIDDPRLRRTEPGCFVAEASDLGFRPGEWPDEIGVTLPDGSSHLVVGGGAIRNREGELEGIEYASGRLLIMVWND